MTHEEREVMARRIKRKLDIRIVPAAALLWLMAFLDRVRLAAAVTRLIRAGIGRQRQRRLALAVRVARAAGPAILVRTQSLGSQ